MNQDKKTPGLPGHITIRPAGMFSTFYLLDFMGRWGAWIVLLASLLITFNAWYFIRDEATKRAQTSFEFRIKKIETSINERLQAYEFLLRGGSGLFEISDEVNRAAWRTYVTKLKINQYYPGIQGVGFSKHILPSEKEGHVRQVRAEGFPQYTINPEGDRPEYTSIIFLEPFDWRNQRAFGYDMFSEPTRKEAMIRARDTGLASLSGKVTLVQETVNDIQAGFLIYLAVYRKGEPLETPEQRNDALIGYVYSPFRMNEFMKGILVEKVGLVNLQIFDGGKPLKETLLYKSDATEEIHNVSDGHHFATNQSILHYAGHRWLLSFVSSKYFEENIRADYRNFILLPGTTISLLLFGIVLSLTRSRSQAIDLANMTLDLEKANIELRQEITGRKKADKEKQALESQLQQAQKMESIGTLAGGIAHDFNNLLYIVMGNISLAQYDPKLDIETSENLKEAEKACVKAKQLTERLITFSKGGAPVKEMISINNFLKDIVISVLSGSNITPKILIGDSIRHANIDEGQIKQVVRNIVVNAKEAMKDNGQLTVSCENVDIAEEGYLTLNQGEYIKISFDDNGCGISKENLEKIFNPYFSTKARGADKGQGLGLTISYSIIQKHGGLINVDSELDSGSTFSVYLPAFSAKNPDLQTLRKKPTEQKPVKQPITRTVKILLMDDEEAIRHFLGKVINRLGYAVETCIEGNEAVEIYTKAMASKDPFDMVILDLTNKIGMGGQATMKRLLEIDPDVKGIIITGYSADPVVANFRAYGFSGFITKPTTRNELSKVIHEVFIADQ